jgi:hypothetical protein
MKDIVIFSDIFSDKNIDDSHSHNRRLDTSGLNKWNFWSRYLGPYTIKQSIHNTNPELSVVVVDYFTKIPNFFEYIKDFIGPDTKFIGLSVTFLQNTFNGRVNDFNLWFRTHAETVAWFKQLKELAPNAKIVIGGHTCDIWYQHYAVVNQYAKLPEAMANYIDCVIHGYGEHSFSNYINGTVDPEHIYQKGKVQFISDKSKAGGATTVCNPITWEKSSAVRTGEWLPLEISKGCRFGCKFCMFDRFGTTVKSAEYLRAELISNYENFGITGYSLTDDTVNDSIEKVKMLHEVFTSLPFKVEWIAYARPDMFHKYPEMLDMMVESGCRGMFLGIETFNAKAAKIAGKGLDPQKIKDILTWIKSKTGNEMFILASFIIGLVGETPESLDETLQYLLTQNVIDKILFEILYVRTSNFRTGAANDFNNNGEKYGFKKLQYAPYYWEHDTLNFTQCQQIAKDWKTALNNSRYSGYDMALEGFTNFWSYPRMRSLGYTHAESFEMLKNSSMPDELYKKNDEWIMEYHSLLKKDNT